MAADAIKTLNTALEAGFAEKGEKVVVWADKSDYKDFIRMYVVSDHFKDMSEKARLGEIYSVLESFGAKSLIRENILVHRDDETRVRPGIWRGRLAGA